MNMMFGFMLVNFSPNPRIFNYLIDIELPIFVCFFTIAGAGLNIKVLLHNWIPAIVFVIARGIGKILGVYIGGLLGKAPSVIKRYLGYGMLPQAGVAIALVLAVQAEFPGPLLILQPFRSGCPHCPFADRRSLLRHNDLYPAPRRCIGCSPARPPRSSV